MAIIEVDDALAAALRHEVARTGGLVHISLVIRAMFAESGFVLVCTRGVGKPRFTIERDSSDVAQLAARGVPGYTFV